MRNEVIQELQEKGFDIEWILDLQYGHHR
jgi:biotin operon repressor